MKFFLLGVVAILLSPFLMAQTKVIANITNLRSDKGVCRACLFNNAVSFKNETTEPFQCLSLPIKHLSTEAVFTNIPAGTYALFVFHDVNGNNKMDRNFLGIPKEGYGASMNRLPFATAPTYEENKFIVDGKTVVRLQVKIRNL